MPRHVENTQTRYAGALAPQGFSALLDLAIEVPQWREAELASFGSRFGPPDDVRRPGNLRTVAVTLKEALRRALDVGTDWDVELVVDGEHFAVMVNNGHVSVRYEPAPEAQLAIETNYEALIAVDDGDMTPAEFGKAHVSVIRGSQKAARSFLGILEKAFNTGDARRTIEPVGQTGR